MSAKSQKTPQKTLLSFFSKSPNPKQSPLKKPKSAASPAVSKGAALHSPPSSSQTSDQILPPPSFGIANLSELPQVETPGNSQKPPSRGSEALPSSPLQQRKRNATAAIDSDSEDEMLYLSSDFDDSDADGNYVEPNEAVEDDDDEVYMELDDEELEKAPSPSAKSKKARISKKQESAPQPVLPPVSVSTATTSGDGSSSLAKFQASSSYIAAERSQKNQPKRSIPTNHSENPERYRWLVDIKDADGKRPSDPGYDVRTLFVPSDAWATFTPFEKQYWEVKSKLWDTIVFFKKGKFYELYEKDASLAHTLFDLKLAGGGRANMSLAGVPEMSFEHWASAFIAKGYKVARVDQKETALAKEMRDTTAGKKEEKIIRRELSCILTAGTLTDEKMLADDLSQYCLSIRKEGWRYASAIVDTSTGSFFLTEFEDDIDHHKLETLIAQLRPREIVVERGNLDKESQSIIKNHTSFDTLWNLLKPEIEFWTASRTRTELSQGGYFNDLFPDTDKDAVVSTFPGALDSVKDSDLMMSAVGGLTWYLQSLKLDKQMLSMGDFRSYNPTQTVTSMVLDGQTLHNLEIFANTHNQGPEGSFFKFINKCITPFGKRKLRTWVGHPLLDISIIKARQDVVDWLLDDQSARNQFSLKFTGLPDIERLLSRIHANALQPKDFAKVVLGLKAMTEALTWVEQQETELNLLKELNGICPPAKKSIAEWLDKFDVRAAQDQNTLIPSRGTEPDLDNISDEIEGLKSELQALLVKYRQQFNSTKVCYRDSGKEIYLIEVPIAIKSIPKNWQQMGSSSKVKRYYSPEVSVLVRSLQEAYERQKVIVADAQFRMYAVFVQQQKLWMRLVNAVATLDCLLSLAETSSRMGTHARPEFIESDRSVLDFKTLRHPCVDQTFIPNDIHLGGDSSNITLLTGANAAGKSTVLRMTCCAVILAQLGCHVPAESARLTIVDKIMTRLGANDNIFAGKSTFHVELSETSRILSEATNHSLVVLDELGRGGSSNDGFAIAESVLYHLATHVGCMGFFATHYSTLMDSFVSHPEVRPQRMAIHLDGQSKQVTFLYRLEDGRSAGSFGMNVALMCGVSPAIVKLAEEAAKKYELTQRLQDHGKQSVPLGAQSDMVWIEKSNQYVSTIDVLRKIAQNI